MPWLIIGLGIVLRIAVYLQNRNLIIDEANVARNLYERGFIALSSSLSYEQFAPPLFLWVLKSITAIFGFSEYALRGYSLFAGIATLFLMRNLLKEIGNRQYWYPLLLIATAYIFIRYSSELKQYMSDAMVTCALMLLALRTSITESKAGIFIFKWFLAGSVAIWLSMPSVFILAGVGVYYLLQCIRQDYNKKLLLITGVGILWLGQFLFYYFIVLQQQVNSDYLQNFHHNQFLDLKDWSHDWEIFSQLFTVPGGYTAIAIVFNVGLFLLGLITLLMHDKPKALLLLVPFLGLVLAAILHQYALVPRLILFILPVILVVLGYGFEMIMLVKQSFLRYIFILVALFCVVNNIRHTLTYNAERERITTVLTFVQENGIRGTDLYVHHGAVPGYIYYTQISPAAHKWWPLKRANTLVYFSDYAARASEIRGKTAFIYTSVAPDELQWRRQAVEKQLREIAKHEEKGGWAYIYSR